MAYFSANYFTPSLAIPVEAPGLSVSDVGQTTIDLDVTLPVDLSNFALVRIIYSTPGGARSEVTTVVAGTVQLTGLSPGQQYVAFAVSESAGGAQLASSPILVALTLRSVSASRSLRLSMVYDPKGRGFFLFGTPASGVGTHWWIDAETKAMWPMILFTTHQPKSAACFGVDEVENVVIGSQDGFVRYFSQDASDDDGVDLDTHVLLGPVRLAADDARDGMLAEIHGILDVEAGGSVTWRVVTGDSAQDAAEVAYNAVLAELDGDPVTGVASTGTWSDSRSLTSHPRSRGVWAVIWLSSSSKWSFEAVPLVARILGRGR